MNSRFTGDNYDFIGISDWVVWQNNSRITTA